MTDRKSNRSSRPRQPAPSVVAREAASLNRRAARRATVPDMPLRLDLAIRTSKRKTEAKSPQQQRDMAQGVASAFGYEIVRTHDSMADESGKTMDRATLRAVMQRVRDG